MSLDITQDILTQAVAEVTEEYGRVNLSALGRRLLESVGNVSK